MTSLLQRSRNAHTAQWLYEAAELQFWWATPRSTDTFPSLFWFDDEGRPEAAVCVTDFGGTGATMLYAEPTAAFLFMSGAAAEWMAHVVERGVAHLGEHGVASFDREVDRALQKMRRVLAEHGCQLKTKWVMAEAWLHAEARPRVSEFPKGYSLLSRAEPSGRPHHLCRPGRDDVELRLRQTSLYRPDLDLVVVGPNDETAAYGMFWNDPETGVGAVEPVRTLEGHQRRGLARHILTSGIDRLVESGSRRISVGYEPESATSSRLYRSVGFERHRENDLYSR